jgi:hypothetical protein
MTTPHTPGYAGFARLHWMFVGPMLAALVAYQILMQRGGWWTRTDFVFVLLVASLPFARWLEFRGGMPQTAEGEPATPDHLRRYAVGTLITGSIAWVVVHVIGRA